MAGIKTIGKQYAEEKLSKSWNEWIKLKKNRKRPSDAGGKRKFFTETLDKLWDIASPDAVEVIEKSRFLTEEKKKEDIAIYEDQKHDRVSSMIGKEKVLHGQLLQQQIRQQSNTAALCIFDEMEVSYVEPVLLNTARNYKVLKTVQRTTKYYKELQDTFKRSTK